MSHEVVTITDPASGATAKVAPSLGFNCFSFQTRHNGTALETLWAAENFSAGTERPSGSGIPLLFPFPGRIRGQQFSFQGQTYTLPGDDGRGNAIHGFVLNRPWQVAERTASRVTGVFHASQVDPQILDQWPADFRLTVSYEVRGQTLASRIRAENCGRGDLPCAFGTHPYFRVPLGGPTAANCKVTVPTRSIWQLEGLLPTGVKLPAEGKYGLAAGMPFAETALDDVFSDLQFSGDECLTSIDDPGSGRLLVMTFDRSFQQCVVYNPPHRQAICLEPYTAVPDPYFLTEQGHKTGLKILKPGEAWEMRIDIRVE